VPGQFRQGIRKFLAAYANFMMARTEMGGHSLGIGEFAVTGFLISDGERFNGSASNLGHQRRNRTGIYAPAEENSQRHITHEVACHHLFKLAAITSDVVTFRVAGRTVGREGKVPIGFDSNLAALL